MSRMFYRLRSPHSADSRSHAWVAMQGFRSRVRNSARTDRRRKDRVTRETRCIIAKRIITSQSMKADRFLEAFNHIVVVYHRLVKWCARKESTGCAKADVVPTVVGTRSLSPYFVDSFNWRVFNRRRRHIKVFFFIFLTNGRTCVKLLPLARVRDGLNEIPLYLKKSALQWPRVCQS